jgi:hypothetical protein
VGRFEKGQIMSAVALVEQFCEIRPRHTCKLLARALGVSLRSAKRYTSQPELFPQSRAIDLLVAIECEERILEARREARREQREAARNEITALMGMDTAGLGVPATRSLHGLGGDEVRTVGSSVPDAGYSPEGAR